MLLRGGWWLLVAAVGCGGPRGSVDTAVVCVGAEVDGTSVGAVEVTDGQTLLLNVSAGLGCHTEDAEVRCDVDLQGSTLVVTTETTWVETEPLAMSCEAILRTTQASCETPPLPAGTYTIAYADDELAFEVPGEVEGCLDGAG